ncbi:MAG TPA: SHD1 domain-containing protein [Chthoniobacterales bacterium]
MKAKWISGVFFGCLLIAACRAEIRTFTDRQGRTVQAEAEGVSNGNVALRLANGSTITVPMAALSDADQSWLRTSGSGSSAGATAPGNAPVKWDYDAAPHGVPGTAIARFRVWMPDSSQPVRGMIVLVPGVDQDGRGAVDAGDWQALAKELRFGLIACSFSSGDGGAGYCYAGKGSGKLLLEALDKFATTQNHPEVSKAPLLLWGHSAGGQFNYNFACWKPDRTLAFVVNEGGYFYDTPASSLTHSTPAILFAGEKDKPERVANITHLFQTGRMQGALWAYCLEKGLGHSVGPSQHVAQQFFRSIVPLRLPESGLDSGMKHLSVSDGLLAARGGDALPASQYKGSPRDASWLPDAATATAWKAVQP